MSGDGGSVHSSLMSETQRSLASLESMMSGSRQMKAGLHVRRASVSAPSRVQHFLVTFTLVLVHDVLHNSGP